MTTFKQKIRNFARAHLPETLRKPLGAVAGKFYEHAVQPAEGFLFDLKGGRFHVDGCVLEIPKHLTSMSYRACFFEGDYEAEERELIREYIRPEDSVLEMGACMGVVSCVTNKLLQDNTKHVVVEGNPYLVPVIQRNREINRCGFLVENCAISDQPEATFFLHPKYIVGGTTQRESNRPVRVPGRTWRELDERYGPFTALVMDIEGSEMEAMESAKDIIKNYRVLIVELHGCMVGEQAVARCRELMQEAGLRFQKSVGLTEAWVRV